MGTESRVMEVAPAEDAFDHAFKRMLDNFVGGNQPRFCATKRAWNPPTDIFETSDAILIKMELAGVTEKEVEVKIVDHFLVIRGTRSDEQHIKKENFHLMEIHYGSFERVFGLPVNLAAIGLTAELKNGFLLVTIPKDSRVDEYRIDVE